MPRLSSTWFWIFLVFVMAVLACSAVYAQDDCQLPSCVYLPLVAQSSGNLSPTATLVPTVPTTPIPTITKTATNTPTDTPTFTPTATNAPDAIATLKAQLTSIAETQTAEAPTPTPTVPTPTATPCGGAVAGASLTTVQFSGPSYNVLESAGNAVISVTLSSPVAQAVTVHYFTADNTAVAGNDYLSVNGILLFVPSETLKSFIVPIMNDNKIEGNESISLSLDTPICAKLGVPISSTLTIIDDE